MVIRQTTKYRSSINMEYNYVTMILISYSIFGFGLVRMKHKYTIEWYEGIVPGPDWPNKSQIASMKPTHTIRATRFIKIL